MMSNPFRSSIVADPWNVLEIDVPEIHAEAFEQCRQAIEVVRNERRTTSVLINGPAGSGKTHLLARLRAHLDRSTGAAPPMEAVFVAVRMQTSARMIWRYLQHRFAADLLQRRQDGTTQLERLFLRRLAEIGASDGLLYRWLSGGRSGAHSLDELDYEVDEVFERIDPNSRISRDLKMALRHLLLGRHRRDAGAWLRGELLPESASATLGIEIGAEEDEDLEFRARHVVSALCGLSGAGAPVIFCFDQVEALQAKAGDNAGLFAFGQLVSVLHAETTNALLVSCIQSAFIDSLQQAVRVADLDRMREFRTIALNPLNWAEARRLISARLNSIPALAARPADSSALWPLREEEIRAVFQNNQCVARKLLSTCAELFDRWRTQAQPDPHTAVSMEEFLEQSLRETLERALAENSPAETDEIFHHAFPMLLGVPAFGNGLRVGAAPPNIDFAVEKGDAPVLLSLCNRSSKSLWRKFDRLRELPAAQVKNLYLLRDERLPISANSVRTLEKRDALVAQGARWISLSAEMMAALDALRSLLSNAKAGDLAREGDAVPLSTVEQWLSRNLARTMPELASLFDDLAGAAPADAETLRRLERLTELLQTHHVISVEDAAGMIGEEIAAVAACAMQHPDRFGVLDGSLMILFELTNEMAEASC